MKQSLKHTTWICVEEEWEDLFCQTVTVISGDIYPNGNGENAIVFEWEDGTVQDMKYRRFVQRFQRVNKKTIHERYIELQQEREHAEQQIQNINVKIQALQMECDHPNIKDYFFFGWCPDCNYRTEGRFCEKSPTKECAYYDKEADVYNKDACIYCKQPKEIK